MDINLNIPDKRLLNLSSLSDDEYSKILGEYNLEKMSTLPVPTQKEIKEIFKKETERRRDLLSNSSYEIDEIEGKKASLEETLSKIQSVFGNNLSYLPGLANDVNNLESELKNCNDKLAELSSNYDAKQSIIDNSKKVSQSRFSITKKRAMDGKNVVIANMKGAKQKICSVRKSLLQTLKNKAKKTYENVLDKTNKSFDAYEEKNNAKQDELNQAMNDLFNMGNAGQTPIDRYGIEKTLEQEKAKTYKRFQKIRRNGIIETYLRNGVIRTLNVPKNIINRIREKQANSLDIQEINEPALSM